MRQQQRVALITGASSGIGEAVARKLAREGFRVILVARRESRLDAIVAEIESEGAEAYPLPSDLSNEEGCLQVYDEVNKGFGGVDVLINNAGIGWYGFGESMPWALARQMIEVNMASLTRLTLMFLSDMKRRARGHIINIGSIAGGIPSQGVALYSATKAFVDALTTSLYRELGGTKVKVSVVRSGPVATPFYDRVAEASAGLGIPVEWFAIGPEEVAEGVWRLIRRPTRVVYVPRALRLVPWFELTFGWLMDRAGPMLLKFQLRKTPSD